MFFSGGSICLSNINFPGGFIEQTCFFKEGLSVRRKDFIILTNRLQFSQKPIFSPRTHKFSRRPLCASNRYLFFRKPYLVLKHILFSRRPLCLEQIDIFQEGTNRRKNLLFYSYCNFKKFRKR